MESEYTNRELKSFFETLHEKIDSNKNDTNEKFGQIIAQTTKTNGRVTALEKWMWTCVGGIGVLTTLAIPVVFSILKEYL